MHDNRKTGSRHSRVPFESAVHLVRSGNAWSTDLIDISATGMLVDRPVDWVGQEGDEFIIDLIIHDHLNIHLKAEVARVTSNSVGLHFTFIPPEKEQEFWSLLGEFAHKRESI